MDEETENQGPPQPVVIQGSAIIEPAEVGQDSSATTTSASSTSAQDMSPVEEALAKVRFLEENKPNTAGLYTMGVLLMVVVPLFLLLVVDVLFTDGAFFCCFSAVVGVVLILVAESKQSGWKKTVQSAKADALQMSNAPVEEAKKYPALNVVGGAVILASLFFEIPPLGIVGILLLTPGVSAAWTYDKDIKRAFAQVLEAHEKKGK
tara:strand:- start:49 stop:666 length:618 start_codon:yes stop_codon:yes gene_type:complete